MSAGPDLELVRRAQAINQRWLEQEGRDAGKVGVVPPDQRRRAAELNARLDTQRQTAIGDLWLGLATVVLWMAAVASGMFAAISFAVGLSTKCLGAVCMSGQHAVPDPTAFLMVTLILGLLAVGLGLAATKVRR